MPYHAPRSSYYRLEEGSTPHSITVKQPRSAPHSSAVWPSSCGGGLDISSLWCPANNNDNDTKPLMADSANGMSSKMTHNTAATSPSSSLEEDDDSLNKYQGSNSPTSMDSDDFSTAVFVSDCSYQHNPHTTITDSFAQKWISSGLREEVEVVVVASSSHSTASGTMSTRTTNTVHETADGKQISGMSSHPCADHDPAEESSLLVDGNRAEVLRRPDFLLPKGPESMVKLKSGTENDKLESGTENIIFNVPRKAKNTGRAPTTLKKSDQCTLVSSAPATNKLTGAMTSGEPLRQRRGMLKAHKNSSSTTSMTERAVLSDEEAKFAAQSAFWKTANDPKSGRAYWYHVKTRETQWRKPMCCASQQERQEAASTEKQTRDFFAIMEANMLRSMAAGSAYTSSPATAEKESGIQSRIGLLNGDGVPTKEVSKDSAETVTYNVNDPSDYSEAATGTPSCFRPSNKPLHGAATSISRPSMVRTISTMEDSVLADLFQRVPSHRPVLMKHQGDIHFLPWIGTGAHCESGDSSTKDERERLGAIQEGASQSSSGVEVELWHSIESNNVAVDEVNSQEPRKVERENSLNLLSLQASRQQASQNGGSFNLSALMRMNSGDVDTARGSNCNFGAARGSTMNLVPEAEDEDDSSSLNDLDVATSRDNLENKYGYGLTRETGSINLLPGGSGQNSDSENNSRGLSRMDGSLQLQSVPSDRFESVARENSMNLSAFANGGDSSRSMSQGGSIPANLNAGFRRDSGAWGSESFLSGFGLSSEEEGEAMLELATITQAMANVDSSSSVASSANSLDELEVLLETKGNRDRLTSSQNATAESSIESSDDEGGTPVLTKKAAPKPQPSVARPMIARPGSFRSGPPKSKKSLEKPGMLRRNTCSTLYVGSTMSAPDKDATIKCVCAVFRAHILQSERESDIIDTNAAAVYHVFNDLESQRKTFKSGKGGAVTADTSNLASPTLEDITLFYRDVFGRAQMESDTIIMSLIYVERLIKITDGALRPRTTNWRSILFSCMVLSSKVWDDLSMWNADFSHTCPAGVEFSLQRVNELEIAILAALHYTVKVPASEYAKYYFLLRSMLIKSGLGSEDLATMNPLDVEGAKQLQHVSSQYQSTVASMAVMQKAAMVRSKSVGTKGSPALSANQFRAGGEIALSVSPISETRAKVGLEHVVHM